MFIRKRYVKDVTINVTTGASNFTGMEISLPSDGTDGGFTLETVLANYTIVKFPSTYTSFRVKAGTGSISNLNNFTVTNSDTDNSAIWVLNNIENNMLSSSSTWSTDCGQNGGQITITSLIAFYVKEVSDVTAGDLINASTWTDANLIAAAGDPIVDNYGIRSTYQTIQASDWNRHTYDTPLLILKTWT